MKNRVYVFIVPFLVSFALAQSQKPDSTKPDYAKIYAFALDGDIRPALDLLKSYEPGKLSLKDDSFKTAFENRFNYADDRSDYINPGKSPISELVEIYRNYWRQSMLGLLENPDSLFKQNLGLLLQKNCKKISPVPSFTDTTFGDFADTCLKSYLHSLGLFTTGYGRTGRFIDLLVWRAQKDTVYHFSLGKENIKARVVFMDDFITLGWEEYSTLGRYYPGGWATKDALYCVRKAYDLDSEDFRIGYLAHESRHFADYKLFPKLSPSDLEYRAKLTELSLAENSLFSTLLFFINNSNHKSDNAHPLADYFVIRDLSRELFHVDFEKDISEWKKLGVKKINQASLVVLTANTQILKRRGKYVQADIKN